jgi:lysozyme
VSIQARIAVGMSALAMSIAAVCVTKFEGTRYAAYQDSGGVWTLCEGHTKGVRAGDTATREQCDAWRSQDLNQASEAITQCVHVPLTVTERAAYISFVYNVGSAAFCKSTLVRKLNGGDHKGACEQLLRWTYADGVQLPGLVTRRVSERDMCLEGL